MVFVYKSRCRRGALAFIVIQRKKIYSFLFVIWSLVLFSPLEQFRILPLFQIEIFNLDFSFTNGAMIMTLSLGSFLFLCYLYVSPSLYLGSEKSEGTFLVANNRWFLVIESLYTAVANIILTNLGVVGQAFFPFLFTLFLFILLSNVIGLIPYSFTVTSHIIFTACLAIVIFTGMVILGIAHHGIHYLNLFLPGGTSLALSFLIIPIEIISFFAKPISLAVRLFANMMAGHTLLKVIAGFAWTMMQQGGLIFVGHLAALGLLVLLYGLELGVALIQSYVFLVLCCSFLNDSINLH